MKYGNWKPNFLDVITPKSYIVMFIARFLQEFFSNEDFFLAGPCLGLIVCNH